MQLTPGAVTVCKGHCLSLAFQQWIPHRCMSHCFLLLANSCVLKAGHSHTVRWWNNNLLLSIVSWYYIGYKQWVVCLIQTDKTECAKYIYQSVIVVRMTMHDEVCWTVCSGDLFCNCVGKINMRHDGEVENNLMVQVNSNMHNHGRAFMQVYTSNVLQRNSHCLICQVF